MGRVFANVPGELGSIQGRVIPKTLKMVLDTSLLNTRQYNGSIKGKVEQYRERSCAPPIHFGVVAVEKGAFWSPSTTVANFTNLFYSTLLIGFHTLKWFQVLLRITNNSIKHQSFVYGLLNNQTGLFQTIQSIISHLFAHHLHVKQFYLSYR